MGFCLNKRFIARYVGLALSAAAFLPAANLTRQVPPHIRSVVRADSHGRLVRTVVVSPRVLPPKVIQAAEVSESGVAASPELAAVPDLVEAAAKRYDVDPLLVHSVIQVESNYNPYAVSPKGAQGLMQLMPATARRFGVRNTFDVKKTLRAGCVI